MSLNNLYIRTVVSSETTIKPLHENAIGFVCPYIVPSLDPETSIELTKLS